MDRIIIDRRKALQQLLSAEHVPPLDGRPLFFAEVQGVFHVLQMMQHQRHGALLGTPLRAGDLVATGSWTGIYWAPAGAQVEVEFAGLGPVQLFT